jgi:hypothetical protein
MFIGGLHAAFCLDSHRTDSVASDWSSPQMTPGVFTYQVQAREKKNIASSMF